ncbi:NAD-dependent epimerase/dehydratase family protein [Aquabacterium sp. OR-4]|uniref:NAD-dependent epimerase/dehydratase family protein n=1 Tax=Aquabacterium sp. OR-4 TaxID=2978127 RepID=UPI0021B20E32|nr:NAD(P)-dependent oxidoreductase [Aquabacterium sp. OR-4]MDT7834353.1 NAD(P)-dependent oxidoreductase [Aquabacterium sp. OR-4]
MKVLVTGSSGRIGQAVLQALQAQGHAVQGLDQRPGPGSTWVGDLADAALLSRALRGVQAVVHAAALHAPQVGQLADAEFERVNVLGTQRLAQAALQAGVRRVVYTSTTALYGAGEAAAHAPGTPAAVPWITEATVPRPRTIYHRSKLAAERVLAEAVAASQGALSLRVLRMSRCFPEPAPLMAVYRLHRGVDARDVAQAHLLALHHGPMPQAGLSASPAGPGLAGGCGLADVACFIVSGLPPFVPADAAALGSDLAGVLQRRCPGLLQAFAQRGWAVPAGIDRVYDPSLAVQCLGWRPRCGFESVLAQWAAGAPEVLAPQPLRRGG